MGDKSMLRVIQLSSHYGMQPSVLDELHNKLKRLNLIEQMHVNSLVDLLLRKNT